MRYFEVHSLKFCVFNKVIFTDFEEFVFKVYGVHVCYVYVRVLTVCKRSVLGNKSCTTGRVLGLVKRVYGDFIPRVKKGFPG